MISIKVDQSHFITRLRTYASLANKGIGEAVKEEAKATASYLVKLTPPKTAKAGKANIESDIDRVYLQTQWFTEVFNFKSDSFGQKVKAFVRQGNDSALESMFSKSAKLSRIHIEGFQEGIIARLRRNGRVSKGIAPWSFPVRNEKQRKDFEDKKKKLAGLAKSGWGACVSSLGGSVSAWLNRTNTGYVRHNSPESITLINKVPYMASLSARMNIIPYALTGRKDAIKKKIDFILAQAARGR